MLIKIREQVLTYFGFSLVVSLGLSIPFLVMSYLLPEFNLVPTLLNQIIPGVFFVLGCVFLFKTLSDENKEHTASFAFMFAYYILKFISIALIIILVFIALSRLE